jgi:hypothetical protein
MSNPASWTDVHTYDNKWNHCILTRFTPREKLNLFKFLYFLIERFQTKLKYRIGLDGLTKIIESNTFDRINNVFAQDILAEICVKLNSYKEEDQIDIVNTLLEQMHDMIVTNGTCPQGQSTRLIQVYNSI